MRRIAVLDTFPDPAMIRGKDGLWHAYGTTNPIRVSAGDTAEHILPVLRSSDLATWIYAGDVYPVTGKPSWWPAGTRPWAPDIRYVDGVYHLTCSMSTGGIALVTAPTPLGPWTDHDRATGEQVAVISHRVVRDSPTFAAINGHVDTVGRTEFFRQPSGGIFPRNIMGNT